jgi:hypothetical protein
VLEAIITAAASNVDRVVPRVVLILRLSLRMEASPVTEAHSSGGRRLVRQPE